MKNFTDILKHCGLWYTNTMYSFAPVYPTSIRGSEDNQRGAPGTR